MQRRIQFDHFRPFWKHHRQRNSHLQAVCSRSCSHLHSKGYAETKRRRRGQDQLHRSISSQRARHQLPSVHVTQCSGRRKSRKSCYCPERYSRQRCCRVSYFLPGSKFGADFECFFTRLDVHNLWGFMEEKATHEAYTEIYPGKRPYLIARSPFTGAGKYSGFWGGDKSVFESRLYLEKC